MNTELNSDNNISLNVQNNENEEIEILNDPRRSVKEVIKDTTNVISNKAEEIKTNIQNEDIYETSVDIPVIKGMEKPKFKADKAMKIQIVLLVLWVVLTVSIYFFGYELFEPIIPIS